MKGINVSFSLPFSLLTALPTPASSLDSDHSLFQENIWDQLEKGTQSKGNVTSVSKYRKHLEGNGAEAIAGTQGLAQFSASQKQMGKSKWNNAHERPPQRKLQGFIEN